MKCIRVVLWGVFLAVLATPALAQDRGVLAIDVEAARHAFSLSGEANAVNRCGTADCEVVATFSACLGVAYSRLSTEDRPVWTWIEADMEGLARRGALDECLGAGGLACESVNVVCVADAGSGGASAAPAATAEQENLFWQSIMDSTNPAEFEAYLAQFPNGVFRALAENRLAALRASADDSPTVGGQPVGGAGLPPAGVAAGSDARPQPGEVFRDCAGCPEMVVIPAGTFRMGCVSGRDCMNDELPVHAVTISRPFALSQYEVTFQEYDRFAVATGRRVEDAGWGRGRRPVINVSWNDAQEYVAWLSSETGARYRLPSEAEWEYAARAGTATAYSWGNDVRRNRANCDGCGSQWDDVRTAPVGSFGANAWGLHDMHGNVWEWVQDCWNEDYRGAPTDGSAWESGDCVDRVWRGGSWSDRSGALRSANRLPFDARFQYFLNGFRVARTLAP